ncbi:transposase [Dictyobacter kobayashii]|uniref:Transposase IS200-like domain-containing protein n=1 Tax=Dictyobacter kobayashii TaxID=2014872 RepID=A0A402ARM5_9CHLR|nr:transposase [Dictyobacter kobayashii]GCE21737.1 hypothetical protein KDK_55370 [Dictyobacter kobayashii]
MDAFKKPRRKKFTPLKPMRLEGYDYHLPGAYTITICARKLQPLFLHPTLRDILYKEWENLSKRFANVVPGTMIVMHNHIHCILIIEGNDPHEKSVTDIIGTYKSIAANAWLRYIKETGDQQSGKIWKTRFYDHIVRGKIDFDTQTAYILNNPAAFEAKQKKHHKGKEE